VLLRRLSEAVRKQNWFTVLIELLVVVIGVVLALQLGQWKQEHELRQREQVVLARIGEELDAMVAHAEAVVAVAEHRVELATLVL
jgi:sensor domain CHASE-containing protein